VPKQSHEVPIGAQNDTPKFFDWKSEDGATKHQDAKELSGKYLRETPFDDWIGNHSKRVSDDPITIFRRVLVAHRSDR
jgi:hypothetical protein